jgi:aspartate ammonia-lyase
MPTNQTPVVEPQRVERDPIGEFEVPLRALYGIQTARALETFQISSHRLHPGLIRAYVEIKKAAALANTAAGALDERRGHAIVRAADEVIDGHWLEHFPLDAFQAGAGTSTNMNVNEVIANRGLELAGRIKGDYQHLDRTIT